MPIDSILLIDNYDSFSRNLEHLLADRLHITPSVIPYEHLIRIDPDDYDLLVISPGPGRPSEYPEYHRLIAGRVPVIGVCLGMQIMNELCGGRTDRLETCIHGKTDRIDFDGRRFEVARYHSLYMSLVADCFKVISANRDGIPMAIRHISKPMIGYQFHPESFMTADGGYFIDYAIRSFAPIVAG